MAVPRRSAPAPAPAGESGEGQLVTEVAAVASVVSALQYVNESAKPDQNCANCQPYTAGSWQRGKCTEGGVTAPLAKKAGVGSA